MAARRAGGARSPEADELSDKRLRVGVPAPPDIHCQDEKALAAAALKLPVRGQPLLSALTMCHSVWYAPVTPQLN